MHRHRAPGRPEAFLVQTFTSNAIEYENYECEGLSYFGGGDMRNEGKDARAGTRHACESGRVRMRE